MVTPVETISPGEKAKARDILAAVATLKNMERERRPATDNDAIELRAGGHCQRDSVIALSLRSAGRKSDRDFNVGHGFIDQ